MKQGVTLTNNHDQFRIEQNNIDKAIPNKKVSFLMEKHYYYLHNLLVKIEFHEDIFQDTYLKLTYNYNPEIDFVEQFEYYFNMLKGWYYRSGKVIKYHIGQLNENLDVEEQETDTQIIETNFEDLRNAILSKAK